MFADKTMHVVYFCCCFFLLRYQHSSAVEITPEMLPMYENGEGEMKFSSAVDVAFVGWFSAPDTREQTISFLFQSLQVEGAYLAVCLTF